MIPSKEKRKLFEILLDLVQCSNKIVPFYSLKYPSVLTRAIHLRYRHGYAIREAMQLGLLELNVPNSQLSKFVSKRKMWEIQKALNPAACEPLTEDKGIFYRYCNILGIPIPQLYAIYFHNTAGYTTNGMFLTSTQEWQIFINKILPSEFIIKPTKGSYGKGFMCFVKSDDDAFFDVSSNIQYEAKDIYDMMFTAGRDFVIQERLMNHPDLMRLSDTKSLQTLRIWTFVNKKAQSEILTAFFKPIVGHNITDNHDHGRTGNLLSDIQLDKGILTPAVKFTPDASGMTTVTSHPKTGISFEGFTIPLWDDVCSLAKEVSLKFLPLRIIGWDIAVTPNGPYIIEANIFADPPNQHKNMDAILSNILE